jgi:Protein of unknown function DUF262
MPRISIERDPANDLLPAEKISFQESFERTETTDEELNSRYAKGDVRIVTESARYSLAGILSMLQETVDADDSGNGKKELRYKLDPEYQRRHRWSVERKSRLIESFLMNVPVPPVFLYERDLARFEVMDGRQRLTALSDFYDNKFALTGLEYWSDLDNRTYAQLPSKIRDGIDRRYISSIILLKETANSEEQAAMLKKIVFERLNSGGVKLSSQETRNAVYQGPLNQLCLKLSENDKFRKMWGIQTEQNLYVAAPDAETETTDDPTPAGQRMFEKMEDVELVLRFFAYRQIGSFKAGLNKISEFLDLFIVEGNRFDNSVLLAYEGMFNATIEFLWQAVGSDVFSVLSTASTQRRPTKIIYDPMMYVANQKFVKDQREKIVKNNVLLRQNLVNMYEEDRSKNNPLFSGRRTNYVDTQQRNDVLKKVFLTTIATIR